MNTEGLDLFDEYDHLPPTGLRQYLAGKFGRNFKISTLLKVETALKSKQKNKTGLYLEDNETGHKINSNRNDPGTILNIKNKSAH